jgi:hypothetical protein
MKKQSLFIAIAMTLLIPLASFSQAKIIFDTDFGGDVDDLGALVMLNNFVDKGECELLAVMCWTTETYAVSAVDAVNRFYKHNDILIGTRKADTSYQAWNYCKPIADKFPHKLSYADVPDATALYRQLLAKSDDKSITIVTVGPLMNIQNLIKSDPDSYSKLTGKELIDKKVKEFVVMGGQFPEGPSEWNFNGEMHGVTRFVFQNIKVPVIFSGYEIGIVIKTGEVFNDIDPDTPLYTGWMHFSRNAPWIKQNYVGKILDNATFDQTAVLYAVRNGTGKWWDRIEGGYCDPDEVGGNKWIVGPASNHSYLKLTEDPEKMTSFIESIMLNKF